MAATTTYDVRLRYLLEDRASGGHRKIGSSARDASRDAAKLRAEMQKLGQTGMGIGGMLRGAALGVAGFFGVSQAKKSLIDFNVDMEQMRLTMAGLMEMNWGGSFAENATRAERVVAQLQQRAKQSAGTTQDMVRMASMLAQPLGAAGAGEKELVDLTHQAVVAAKALGIEWDVAARDIDQALRGQFHAVDPFASKLLGSKEGGGFSGEEGRERFNRMSAARRFQAVQRALGQRAIADMARAQETSFAGVTSTLQDNLQMALAKVGLPLFREITAEVKKWNAWIDTNQERISQWGRDFGQALVSGFNTFKSVAGWFVENREALLALAKVWIGLKVGQGVMNITQTAMTFGSSLASAASALTGAGGFVAAINPAILALAGLTGAFHGFLGIVESRRDRQLEREGFAFGPRGMNIRKSLAASQLAFGGGGKGTREEFNRTFAHLRSAKVLTSEGRIDREKLAGALSNFEFAERQQMAKQLGGASALFYRQAAGPVEGGAALADALIFRLQQLGTVHRFEQPKVTIDAAEAAKLKAEDKKIGKGIDKVNININRIEVASDDPDRFIFDLERIAEDAVRNSSSSRYAFREG